MSTLEVLFQQFKAGYENNWQSMQIRLGSAGEAKKEAARLLNNKTIYQQIKAGLLPMCAGGSLAFATTANPDSISIPTSATANL